MTTGQTFATALRKTHNIGPRTRWSRNGQDYSGAWELRTAMTWTIQNAEAGDPLHVGYHVIYGWLKHVDGGRIDAVQSAALRQLSPYRWAVLLGEMIDAGIGNAGEAERWYASKCTEHQALYRELFATG